MSARIYIEGGGDSKELHARCREGFRRLLEKCEFSGRMPRLVASGGRDAAFKDFVTAHSNSAPGEFVAMLIDSEDPVRDLEQTWAHLQERDQWQTPAGAVDEQVLLMTTCMETWICTDHRALQQHFGTCLIDKALPHRSDMESRSRATVQDALKHATRACSPPYSKGRISFSLVGNLNPEELRQHLPSFVRSERVLRERL